MGFTTIISAWQGALKRLERGFGKNESRSLLGIVFEHFFKLDRVGLAINGTEVFSLDHLEKLQVVVDELLVGTPIQYLTGSAHFFGLEFFVDNRVLIPRPETEELVQWIIDDNLKTKDLNILDIGTGSGCIAISLAASIGQAQVEACDLSDDALIVAELNAKKNRANLRFFRLDILAEDLSNGPYDIIVSNPPYVTEKEKSLMQKNVLEHEPHTALFVHDNNPLLFYEAIATKAFKALKPNGKLYLEINENLGDKTVNCLQKSGFTNIELRKDMREKDRMIKAINC